MPRGVPSPVSAPPQRRAAASSAWSIRLYDAADEVFWAVKLSLLWISFTVVGGVLLGVGPATLAAFTVARLRASGESFHLWSAFIASYRREFGRGALLVLPLAGATFLLFANYFYFDSVGAPALRLATVGALLALAVIAAYLLPMAVHYDLRTSAYLPKASLFAITRPAASVLLLFVLVAFGYAVSAYPFLVIVAVGGWIRLDMWLCLRLFAENEARRNAKGTS